MELKKLHMGTMSYSLDTMDEIMTHLATAFGQQEEGECDLTSMSNQFVLKYTDSHVPSWRKRCRRVWKRKKKHCIAREGYRAGPCTVSQCK